MGVGATYGVYTYDGVCWRNFRDWSCLDADYFTDTYTNATYIASADHITVATTAGQAILSTNTTSWLESWNYRKKKTITGTTAGNQYNYQMGKIRVHKLIGTDTSSGSNGSIQHIYIGSNVRNDFGDIRFTKSDGVTLLDYSMESYVSGDYADFWVELDISASPSTTDIYIYYGNASATTLSNGSNTFSLYNVSGIAGFWHMNETSWSGISADVIDETGVNNGTAYGGVTTTTDGKYFNGGNFDGSDDYVDCGNNNSLDFTDAVMIEAYINGSGNTVDWWDNNWSYKRQIDISPSTPSAYHWLRVPLTSSFNYSGCKTNGEDIRFVTTTGTELKYWVEVWNNGGNSVFWVRIPTASTSSIWLYYGNASASSVALSDDGNLTVSSSTYMDDTRTNLSISASSGATSLTVSSGTGFSANNEILIINLQGTSSDNTNVGTYEIRLVQSVVSNAITLNEPLVNSYSTTQKIMIQKTPRYKSVTVNNGGVLTAHDWDGNNGGVVIFRAGNVTINSGGKIDVMAKGYRGGTNGRQVSSLSLW